MSDILARLPAQAWEPAHETILGGSPSERFERLIADVERMGATTDRLLPPGFARGYDWRQIAKEMRALRPCIVDPPPERIGFWRRLWGAR